MSAKKCQGPPAAAGGRAERGTHSLVVLGFFKKDLFKIQTGLHIKIAAFPSSCRGSHVSRRRARDCKPENKETKKQEKPTEGEMSPPPPSCPGHSPSFRFLSKP